MTEEEAKMKWCPFARPSQNHPDGCGEVRGNRVLPHEPRHYPDDCLCLGSDCMAWRWYKWQETENVAGFLPETRTHTSTMDGHCGLAGSE